MKLVAAGIIAGLMGAPFNGLAGGPGQAVAICTGDGATRSVVLSGSPLPAAPQNPGGGKGDCLKACHTGTSRKRASGII
jgi:hypothetical protein